MFIHQLECWAFYLYVLEKMQLPCMASFFWTYMYGLKTKFSFLYSLSSTLLVSPVSFPTIGYANWLKCPSAYFLPLPLLPPYRPRNERTQVEKKNTSDPRWRTEPTWSPARAAVGLPAVWSAGSTVGRPPLTLGRGATHGGGAAACLVKRVSRGWSGAASTSCGRG
jgi:hypothetical protein